MEVKRLLILKEKCSHNCQNYYLIYLKTEWIFLAKLKICCLLQLYNKSDYHLLSSCYKTLYESFIKIIANAQMTLQNRLNHPYFTEKSLREKGAK